MDDLKEIQKKAAAQKDKPVQKKKPAKQDNKKNKIVIRNTNTAMGKALAAAMGGMELQQENTATATATMDKEAVVTGSLEK